MRCSICNSEFQPEQTEAMPFCSERCRSIDLGRWLDQKYGLPRVVDPDADELPEEPWSNGHTADDDQTL